MARTLDQISAELGSAYQPQIDQINQQVQALPAYYTAQQAGLDQAKTNAFGDITNAASARGMAYSGMPIAEQAKYVGTKYLPAMAGLAQQQSQQKFGLMNSLNQVNQQRFNQAQSIQSGELNREAQLQAAAMKAAATRAAAASRAPSAGASKQAAIGGMAQALRQAAGTDGYVSPETWRQALGDWTAQGYGASEFNNAFRNYANMTYGGASAGGDYGLKR